jgi:hypothetical protein
MESPPPWKPKRDLVLHIKIADLPPVSLRVNVADDPKQLAIRYIEEHSLGDEVLIPLFEKICTSLVDAYRKALSRVADSKRRLAAEVTRLRDVNGEQMRLLQETKEQIAGSFFETRTVDGYSRFFLLSS